MKELCRKELLFLSQSGKKAHLHSSCTIITDEHFEFICQFSLLEPTLDRTKLAILQSKCVQRTADSYEGNNVFISEIEEVLCFNVVRWEKIVVFLDCDCLPIVRSHENCSIAEGNSLKNEMQIRSTAKALSKFNIVTRNVWRHYRPRFNAEQITGASFVSDCTPDSCF